MLFDAIIISDSYGHTLWHTYDTSPAGYRKAVAMFLQLSGTYSGVTCNKDLSHWF